MNNATDATDPVGPPPGPHPAPVSAATANPTPPASAGPEADPPAGGRPQVDPPGDPHHRETSTGPAHRVASAVYWRARAADAPVRARARQARRAAFIARARLAAAWLRVPLELEIAGDADIAANVRLRFTAGAPAGLVVGPGAHIAEGVLLDFRGGSLHLDAGAELRRGCVCHLGGRCHLGPQVVLSYGTIVHCSERIEIGRDTVIGEYSTITDSAHRHGYGPVHHTIRTAPVAIGQNCWIGAKATLARGVRVGDEVVVGANSLVTGTVDSGERVLGVPAAPRVPTAGARHARAQSPDTDRPGQA